MYPNQSPYPNTAPAPSYAKQIQSVKDFVKRPIVYIIASLLTLNFIVSIISVMVNNVSALSAVKNNVLNSSVITGSLCFGWILSGVLILGVWLTCLKSSPDTGLSVLKVVNIINIVIMGIALVLMTFALIIVVCAESSFNYSSTYGNSMPFNSPVNSATLTEFVFVILLLSFGVILFCYISVLRFASSMHASLKSPLLKSGGSLSLAVLSIIFAVFDCLTLIFIACIPNDPHVNVFNNSLALNLKHDWLSVATYIILLACHICLAILGFSYRSYAEKINTEIAASMPPQAYPGFPVPPLPPTYMPYPGQPVNPPYPYPQQDYTPPAPQEYTNPYTKSDAAAQAPVEDEQTRYCPFCGAPTKDPSQTNCSNCGNKF